MNYYEFWEMNPHILRLYSRGYSEKCKMVDEMMWSMGQYVLSAVYVATGRVVHGGEFTAEYPSRPFTWPKKTDEELEAEQMERELQEALRNEELYIAHATAAGLPKSNQA